MIRRAFLLSRAERPGCPAAFLGKGPAQARPVTTALRPVRGAFPAGMALPFWGGGRAGGKRGVKEGISGICFRNMTDFKKFIDFCGKTLTICILCTIMGLTVSGGKLRRNGEYFEKGAKV